MYTEYITIQDVPRLRKGIDPKKSWLSDEEIEKIIRVSGCDLNKSVIRCFLSIQQKASKKNDKTSVINARNQLTRFETGWLKI